jgi:hypothetical protein
MYRNRYGGGQMPGLGTEHLIRIVEACAGGCADNGNIPGLSYRSLNWFSNVNWNTQWNAAASFVTGSHNVKVGYQGALLIDQRKNFGNDQFLQYRVNNAVPDQITITINRFPVRQSVRRQPRVSMTTTRRWHPPTRTGRRSRIRSTSTSPHGRRTD